MYTSPPTQESAPEGPNLIVGSRGMTDSGWRAKQAALSLSDPFPTYRATTQPSGLPGPGKYLRLLLRYYYVTTYYVPRQRNVVQMKEQIEIPEKELSNKEMAKLSDAEFKTLVIRMFTEMVKYGHKIEEEVNAMQSEIKENVQGTNSEGKETKTQIKDLEQKEEINIQPEQDEETRIQKNEERLRILWDFKRSNI